MVPKDDLRLLLLIDTVYDSSFKKKKTILILVLRAHGSTLRDIVFSTAYYNFFVNKRGCFRVLESWNFVEHLRKDATIAIMIFLSLSVVMVILLLLPSPPLVMQ